MTDSWQELLLLHGQVDETFLGRLRHPEVRRPPLDFIVSFQVFIGSRVWWLVLDRFRHSLSRVNPHIIDRLVCQLELQVVLGGGHLVTVPLSLHEFPISFDIPVAGLWPVGAVASDGLIRSFVGSRARVVLLLRFLYSLFFDPSFFGSSFFYLSIFVLSLTFRLSFFNLSFFFIVLPPYFFLLLSLLLS